MQHLSDRIKLCLGDITQCDTQAIANAANKHLAGGGGVDGAIHRAGGAAIMAELKKRYKGCPTGQAVITGAGNLKAEYVIHAVGPRYTGSPKDPELLRGAYLSCLELCAEHGIRSIAFPSISTGIYAYPLHEAAPIALKTVLDYLMEHSKIELVCFVLFNQETLDAYQTELEKLL